MNVILPLVFSIISYNLAFQRKRNESNLHLIRPKKLLFNKLNFLEFRFVYYGFFLFFKSTIYLFRL